MQGSSDFSVLTLKGETQAETSRQMLIDDGFDVCFTSPLIRSKRTAEIIWDGRGEEMIPEPELREIDLYSFQGLLKHEGRAKFGEAYRKWQSDAAIFNIDGHYPVRELWARARDCWTKILTHEGKSVLVVAHNAVNQALVTTEIDSKFSCSCLAVLEVENKHANHTGLPWIHKNQYRGRNRMNIGIRT